jgi:hypothetical protein
MAVVAYRIRVCFPGCMDAIACDHPSDIDIGSIPTPGAGSEVGILIVFAVGISLIVGAVVRPLVVFNRALPKLVRKALRA